MSNQLTSSPKIKAQKVSLLIMYLNVAVTLFYFSWWFSFGHIGNIWLYSMLFIGEMYHVLMILLFLLTIRGLSKPQPELPQNYEYKDIDVFITVAGEPVEVVRNTVIGLQRAKYHHKHIFILNDSFVAKKQNWREYEELAQELGVACITRKESGGAKAGNINHALLVTQSELIAIFDADMVPHSDFFLKTIPYFSDSQIGFVQTPQYYLNHKENEVSSAAWEQQEFFFGPIMRGKQANNAAFICGTNVVLRRQAIQQVGGINETSIAEDFLTSLLIHEAGWKSLYVPEVLAEGLAPEDLLSYYKQQLRWARGSLDVLFHYNPLFSKSLNWRQKLEYLSSALFYCNGLIVLMDSIIPLILLATGRSPISSSTTIFAFYFLPFMMSTVYSLHVISGNNLTLRAISFTQSSWYLQIIAFLSAASGQKMSFSVTSKKAISGNFLFLAYPHFLYIFVACVCIGIGIHRQGLDPSIITNVSWIIFNILLSLPFILAASPRFTFNLLKNRNVEYS